MKRRKAQDLSTSEREQIAQEFMFKINQAAEDDEEAVMAGRPALNKLKMLRVSGARQQCSGGVMVALPCGVFGGDFGGILGKGFGEVFGEVFGGGFVGFFFVAFCVAFSVAFSVALSVAFPVAIQVAFPVVFPVAFPVAFLVACSCGIFGGMLLWHFRWRSRRLLTWAICGRGACLGGGELPANMLLPCL